MISARNIVSKCYFCVQLDSFPKCVLPSNWSKFSTLSLIINTIRINKSKFAQISFKLSKVRKMTALTVQECLLGKLPMH